LRLQLTGPQRISRVRLVSSKNELERLLFFLHLPQDGTQALPRMDGWIQSPEC